MTVRRRLKASAAIAIVLALAILAILLVTDRGVEGSLAKAGIADRVIAGIFELNILTQAFILRPLEERPREQWLMRDASLRKLISEIRIEEAQEEEVLNRILVANNEASEYFSELVAFQDKQTVTSGKGEPTRQEIERLSNQLISRTQLMVNHAMRLKELSNAAIYANRRFSFQLVFGSALALILLALASSLSLWRNIGGGLRELEQGTAMLKVGNLDYRLPAIRSDELGRLAQAFNDMAMKLKESYDQVQHARDELGLKVRELQNFSFIASHDLSEPLRKIQTFGDLLKAKSADRLDEQSKDYISRMTMSANRMQELLDALLRYSRVDTKGQEFRPSKLDDVVRDAVADLELPIQNTKARVEIGHLPKVSGDPRQLRQLFQNLIANAVKYRSEVNPVIKIYGLDGTGRIFVEDNGIGFDEKYLDKIFQPFQRLHGKDEYPGTGMGLAICQKIVERHKGTITARSTPGKGSTFIVSLPVDGTKEVNKPR